MYTYLYFFVRFINPTSECLLIYDPFLYPFRISLLKLDATYTGVYRKTILII